MRPFLSRLCAAAEWAVLFGLKLAIVLLFIAAVWFGIGEFAQTRNAARQGAAAFQYLQQIEQAKAAQQQKAQPKPAEKP
jgi:hypothetical protein